MESATRGLSSQPKKIKTGAIVAISAGVLLVAGGIWTAIYLTRKSKEKRASEEKERQDTISATQGRGEVAYTPYVPPAGETPEQARERIRKATQGRGIDGISFA